MKIFDRLGNELRPGDTVYFQQLQTIVVVLDVEEPGILTPAPGCLSLGHRIPFMPEKGKTDALFADLIKVYTPDAGNRAEATVNSILDRVGRRAGNGR